jgi:hypothetical protein
MNATKYKGPARAVFIFLLAVGFGLRWAASRGEFWFDEVLSWHFARDLHSWLEIFTRLHHDNNHYLNTWLLYLLGDLRDWRLYRVPSVVFAKAGSRV